MVSAASVVSGYYYSVGIIRRHFWLLDYDVASYYGRTVLTF